MTQNHIEIIGRVFLTTDKGFVVCRAKGKDWVFLPGGHIEFNESIEAGVHRELKEELDLKIKTLTFMGLLENFYQEESIKHHEINVLFSAHAPETTKFSSKEAHIEFEVIPFIELNDLKLLPVSLKKTLNEWLKSNKKY